MVMYLMLLAMLGNTFLLGCRKEEKVIECSEEKPCGFGATCVEGVCESNTCAIQ